MENQNKNMGIVVPKEGISSNYVEYIQNQHIEFMKLQYQQNMLTRKYILSFILLIIVIVACFCSVLFIFSPSSKGQYQSLHKEMRNYKKNLSEKFSHHSDLLEKNQQKSLDKIHQLSKSNQKAIIEFLLRVQNTQQKIKQRYEKQILENEKKKIDLQNKIRTLAKSMTHSEMIIIRLKEENRILKEELQNVKKIVQKDKAKIKELESKIVQMLSPEELELLKKDDRKDD